MFSNLTNHYNSATIATGGEYEFTKKNADESVQVSEDSTSSCRAAEKGCEDREVRHDQNQKVQSPGDDWLPEVRERANPRSQTSSGVRGLPHLCGVNDPESWFDDMKKAQPKIKR